jgi:hypothetical protein
MEIRKDEMAPLEVFVNSSVRLVFTPCAAGCVRVELQNATSKNDGHGWAITSQLILEDFHQAAILHFLLNRMLGTSAWEGV